MPMAWVATDNITKTGTYGASLTSERIVTQPFRITAGGARMLRVDIKVSGVTLTTAITITFRDSSDGFVTSFNKKTASVTGNGTFSIKFLAEDTADQVYLPLRTSGDLVISTGVGDTVTIDDIKVMQEN